MNRMQWAFVAIVIIVLAFISVIAYSYFNNQTTLTANPPRLTATLLTLSGRANTSPTLNVSITNDGGEAKDVSLKLVSNAFGQATKDSIDVPASQTVYASIDAQISDVTNGPYDVTISFQYSGTNTVNTTSFYVLPSIGFTDVHFVMVGGFFGILASEKNTIGQSDNTTLIFEIKSDSTNSTYTSLTATATLPQGTESLSITPNPISISDIGPQGTSKEYSFAVRSYNAPVGKYTITIHVFSGQGQNEAISNSSEQVTVS